MVKGEGKAEVAVVVKTKEDVKVMEAMKDAEHITVFIFGRIEATEMVPVTMVAVEEAKAETVVVETDNMVNNHTTHNSIKIYLCFCLLDKATYHLLWWHR